MIVTYLIFRWHLRLGIKIPMPNVKEVRYENSFKLTIKLK